MQNTGHHSNWAKLLLESDKYQSMLFVKGLNKYKPDKDNITDIKTLTFFFEKKEIMEIFTLPLQKKKKLQNVYSSVSMVKAGAALSTYLGQLSPIPFVLAA